MERTPKSLRLHIGLFGRTNVGKSSFLNMVTGQDVAITSPVAGTTTDVVEKTMELHPLGPVVFKDTAGIDDTSALASQRLKKTTRAFESADMIIVIAEPDVWSEYEEKVIATAASKKIPSVVVINKADLQAPSQEFVSGIGKRAAVMVCSSTDPANRDRYVNELKKLIFDSCPARFLKQPALLGDLIPAGGTVVMIMPIDLEAPKGRIILPQVQAVRDCLDHDSCCVVVKEHQYPAALGNLKRAPDLVVCDSQVVHKMVADTPRDVPCTTFSILFARYNADLLVMAQGVCALGALADHDRILIAEACTHHAIEDDIGRVKIPRWIRQHTKARIEIEVCSGADFPDDLRQFKLVIHCGGCMFNRRLMLSRIEKAQEQGVAITNYGLCIAYVQGVIERVLSPFPAALENYREFSHKK
jgi:[FeFe] hydrogenase H-cluster maturation GTPase HydF